MVELRAVTEGVSTATDLLINRAKYLRMLVIPTAAVLTVYGLFPEKLVPIHNNLPQFQWIDRILVLQDSVLHLWAIVSLIVFLTASVWAYTVKSRIVTSWGRVSSKWLAYILECSMLWMAFQAFSVIYLENPPSIAEIIEDSLSWPFILWLGATILAWMLGWDDDQKNDGGHY